MTVMVPKKMPMSLQLITFFSIVISGSERPTMPIMKAMAWADGGQQAQQKRRDDGRGAAVQKLLQGFHY